MAATSVADKAQSFVDDGLVTFIARDEKTGRPYKAKCGAYDLRRGRNSDKWLCTCAAGWYRQSCSHSMAAELAAKESAR